MKEKGEKPARPDYYRAGRTENAESLPGSWGGRENELSNGRGHSPTKSNQGVVRIKRILQPRATHSGSKIYHDEHFL